MELSPLLHSSDGFGHRVRKTHPEGGFNGLGTSPSSIILDLVRSITGSGIGTAESRALVYG